MAKKNTKFKLMTILQIIFLACFFLYFIYSFLKTHNSMMNEFKDKNNSIEGFLSENNKIDEGKSKLLKKLNDAKKEVLDQLNVERNRKEYEDILIGSDEIMANKQLLETKKLAKMVAGSTGEKAIQAQINRVNSIRTFRDGLEDSMNHLDGI